MACLHQRVDDAPAERGRVLACHHKHVDDAPEAHYYIITPSARRASGGRMGADAPTQTGRFEDALLPHSFGVPFRKRSVTEARHFRNKLNGLCLSTQPYLQIYKIPKIPLRIKKIDCLTTTNLVNLKSNTMKNTLQMYGLFHLLYKIRHTKCIT